MNNKHKRHKLSSAWSPYPKGYVSKDKPIPSHIDVQGGEKLKPVRPLEVERLNQIGFVVDSEDWRDIE